MKTENKPIATTEGVCPDCNGTGEKFSHFGHNLCDNCNGTGRISQPEAEPVEGTAEQILQPHWDQYRTKSFKQAALDAMEEYTSLKLSQNWISVKDRLPEQFSRCLFVVDSRDVSYHGKVYGGVYTGTKESEYRCNEFSTPGCGLFASHWMYSPNPPKF